MRLCQLVPVFLIVWVSGCSCGTSHQIAEEDGGHVARVDAGGGITDYRCVCCEGVERTVSSESQCASACEGLCPPDGSCAPAGDLVCFDEPAMPGVTLELRTAIAPGPDGVSCFCGQRLEGDTRFLDEEGAPRGVIESRLCPPVAYCDACGASPELTGSLGVPPFATLPEGNIHFLVNGVDGFDVQVYPETALVDPIRTCTRTAAPGGCGGWEPQGFDADAACYPAALPSGSQAIIRVRDSCSGCDRVGPCTVTVDTGNTIHVSPTRLPDTCGTPCPEVCGLTEHLCVTPTLPAGTYDLLIDGLSLTDDLPSPQIVVSSDARREETCRGASF